MLGTFILYLSMACFGYLWLKRIVRTRKCSSISTWLRLLFPLFILSIIIGGRFEVGTDWENYAEYYSWYKTIDIFKALSGLLALNLEPMFILLMGLCGFMGFSQSFFFTIIAFGIFVLILGGHKNKLFLLPLILFYFFGQMFGISMNIIRQAIAISIFFYSLQYLGNSRIKLLICIVFAALFHYSSIVLAAALVIDNKIFSILDRRNFVLFIFILTYLIGPMLVGLIDNVLPLHLFSDKYVQSANNLDNAMTVNSGLGIIARKVVDAILIITSTKIIDYYQDDNMRYVYRLYFVGIILANIMGVSEYLARLVYGYELLRIMVLAYYTYYAFRSKNALFQIIALMLIALNVLFLFMGVMNSSSGCSPYQFLWQ